MYRERGCALAPTEREDEKGRTARYEPQRFGAARRRSVSVTRSDHCGKRRAAEGVGAVCLLMTPEGGPSTPAFVGTTLTS